MDIENVFTEHLSADENQQKVFMPNEIFEDLKDNLTQSRHIAFTYSYYYLITYLYRYCKWSNFFKQGNLKEILGYRADNKAVNKIIKHNGGLLSELNYTYTTKDFPINWKFTLEDEFIEFFTVSNYDQEGELKDTFNRVYGKNFKIAVPAKAFWREPEDKETSEEYTGTFYDVSNTHLVPFDAFEFCMINKNIGVLGFYLYAYLRHKNQMFDGYDVSMENLADEVGFSSSTLEKYLDLLRKHRLVEGFINLEFESYVHGLSQEERLANTYFVNEPYQFSYVPKPYRKAKRISLDEYKKRKEQLENIKDEVDNFF